MMPENKRRLRIRRIIKIVLWVIFFMGLIVGVAYLVIHYDIHLFS